MFCGKCGNQINQGEKFCGKCGNPMNDTQPMSRTTTQPIVQSVAQSVNSPTIKKSVDKKIKLIIVAVVVCVAVLIGAICLIVLFINNSDPVGGDDFYYNSGDNFSQYEELDSDVYRGRGFTIKAEGYGFYGGIDDSYSDNRYWAFLTNDYNSEIEIFVYESQNPEEELGYGWEGWEQITLDSITAYVYDDGEFISINAYSDKYIYSIDCEGNYEGVQNAYDIILNNFKVTEYEYYQIAEDVYQGRGFILKASGYYFDGGIDDSYGDNRYWAWLTNYTSEIEMNVLESDNPKAEIDAEITEGVDFGEETILDGVTAYKDETVWDDGNVTISIVAYSDKYIYSIECEGDFEGVQKAYDMILNNFKVTD